MVIISQKNRTGGQGFPWIAGVLGFVVGLAILYFSQELPGYWWPEDIPEKMSPYMMKPDINIWDIPVQVYAELVLVGFLIMCLFPGHGKFSLAIWMLHNQPSGRKVVREILRAWGLQCGILIVVFCNLFFLGVVENTTLYLYIFILQHVSIIAEAMLCVMLVRDALRLAKTTSPQLADLRKTVVLILGFQTIFPVRDMLIFGRQINMLLGWSIAAALLIGVLLALLLVAGLTTGIRHLIGEKNCQAWRGQFALFNGVITACVLGRVIVNVVFSYPYAIADLLR